SGGVGGPGARASRTRSSTPRVEGSCSGVVGGASALGVWNETRSIGPADRGGGTGTGEGGRGCERATNGAGTGVGNRDGPPSGDAQPPATQAANRAAATSG